jgi:hypothetical protein
MQSSTRSFVPYSLDMRRTSESTLASPVLGTPTQAALPDITESILTKSFDLMTDDELAHFDDQLKSLFVTTATFYPELDSNSILDYGVGLLQALLSKIRFISGVVLNPAAHFEGDQLIVSGSVAELTYEIIAEITAEYENRPGISVLVTEIARRPYIYRSMTKRDIDGVDLDTDGGFDRLLTQAVIWPKDINWEEEPFAVHSVLEAKIAHASGYQANVTIDEDDLIF